MLLNLRDLKMTDEDYKLLATRFSTNLKKDEIDKFQNALRLYPTNAEAHEYNKKKLQELKLPVVKIKAHNSCKEARDNDGDETMGLEQNILLAEGARIMLRMNLWDRAGLVNGAMGTVRKIIYKDEGPPGLSYCVLVKFDNYTGPSITNEPGVVPIQPYTARWYNGTKSLFRTQLPIILAWAITIHKSQGAAYQKCVVDISAKPKQAELPFVALCRVKSIDGLLVIPNSKDRFCPLSKTLKARLVERLREVSRLKILHDKTMQLRFDSEML